MRDRKAPDELVDAWLEWCSFSELSKPEDEEGIKQWESASFWVPDNWHPLYLSDLQIFYFRRINEDCPHPRFDEQANEHLKTFRDWLRKRVGKKKLDIGFVTFGTLREQEKPPKSAIN
jgi:hypothetical protein